MITLQSIQLFALNVAIVSSLCFAIALGLSRLYVSLPKRYATLAVGLVAGLLAPLVVVLGTWCSLGLLPAMPSQPAVVMPIAIDMGAPTQAQLPRSSEMGTQLASDPYSPASSSVPYSPKLVINRNADGIAIVDDASQAPQRPTWPMIIGTALLVLWAIGSLLLLFGQVRKLILCRQFLTGCRQVDDPAVQKLFAHTKERLGINRDVQLLESDSLPTPVVIGCWQPRVILPSEIQLTLSRSQLASVLTHELSHIRRKDHHMATLQTMASLLYWWNPLYRLSSRRISELREMICDDIATADDVAPREYAQTIVQMAARTVATRELALSLGISLSPISELERRLTRIIADRTGNVDISISKRFTTALLAMSALLISGLLFAQVPQVNELKQSTDATPLVKRESTPEARKYEITELAGQVVDPEGKAVADATVYYLDKRAGKETPVVTDASGKFRFSVALNESMFMDAILRAESNDGKLQGYFQQPYRRGNSMSPKDIVVNIAPLKSLKIQVTDSAGLPIEGANAAIELKYRNMVGPVLTDANGIATFNLPQTEKAASTMAWKDGSGLDYRVYKASNRGHYEYREELPDLPPDNLQTLKLEGAIQVKVRAVDDQGHPMAGVTFFNSLDRKYGQKDPGIPDCKQWLGAKTNADGWATVNWIPTWQKSPVEFWAFSDGFAAAAKKCDLKSENHNVEIVMYPTVSISGRITFTDGEPATYIGVKAHGELEHELREFGGSSLEGGRYEFRVPIDQKYTVSVDTQSLKIPFPSRWNPGHRVYGADLSKWEVQNSNWIANEHAGVAAKRNQDIQNIDFVMSRSEANVVDDSDEFDSDR